MTAERKIKQIAKSSKSTFRVRPRSPTWTKADAALTAAGSDHWGVEKWETWLKSPDRPTASKRFNELIASGCSRPRLTALLMGLHSSRQWRSLSKQTLNKALRSLEECREALDVLGDSDIAFWLHLRRVEDVNEGVLEPLQSTLKSIEILAWEFKHEASERKSTLRDRILAALVRYVRTATEGNQDAALSELLPMVLNQPAFSFDSWVKRNRDLIQGSSPT